MATYLRRITLLVCIATLLTGSFDMSAAAQPAKERFFAETGYKVQGIFLDYWNTHGGIAQQGYPISEEMFETSELDGKRHKVQYFERAVFERHSENKPPYDLLLSQLGTLRIKARNSILPHSGATPTPATGQTHAPVPSATKTATSAGSCKPVSDTLKSKIASTGPVAISNLSNSGQEYVELSNNSAAAVDLAGWTLRDKNDIRQKYLFPPGSKLDPGNTLQVYTEAGHPYSFNRKGSIWNNCGDAVELLDTTGSIVATYAYGRHLIR